MNRKGDAPFVLLVFLALALCIITIFFILFSGKEFSSKSKELNDIMSEARIAQEYSLEVASDILNDTLNCNNSQDSACLIGDVKERYKEIAKRYNVGYPGNLVFFKKVKEGEFSIDSQDGIYVFEMIDMKVTSERGTNKIIRNFNITIEQKGS